MRFTALLHHVYSVDALRDAYFRLERKAAPGVDGETWDRYGEQLESHLQDLSERLKRGAYLAKPVRRVYIPKATGGERPLGVPALEDKLVQLAVAGVLHAIYETDFLGFSYGFRPGRGAHDALDALAVGIEKKNVRWVLDADIRGFFSAIDHGWMVRFVEHRIADRRVVRLIQKWLSAGVLEDGELRPVEEGTPQGGSISPVLANVYLHYVLDLWAHRWRQTRARGEVVLVRYADDFVVGFEVQADAERFWKELRERFAQFGLDLHPEKTRLVEFGRHAARDRASEGRGKPETFDFLGFTHVHPIPEVGRWLGSVVNGHCRYYGVPYNQRALEAFRREVTWLWRQALMRRSQRAYVTWSRMRRLREQYLPPVRLHHPYPDQRFRVRTRGRSPVR